MKTTYHASPIFESAALNSQLGKRVFFKMESHQASRSFKLRGMDHLVRHHFAQGKRHFVASSGGNAGYSLAMVCNRLGAKAIVFVPSSTSRKMQELIASEGADLVVAGEYWPEAHAAALVWMKGKAAVYVSPFDDPLLWEGHSSMIKEIPDDFEEPDLIIASVGGGGLMCGIMQGMVARGWNKAEFLGTETHGAASYAACISSRTWTSIEKIATIATTLGAKQIAREAFEWTQKRTCHSQVCSDSEALLGVRKLAEMFNVIAEPACGTAVQALFSDHPALTAAKSILVVVCGGAAIDLEAFEELWAENGL